MCSWTPEGSASRETQAQMRELPKKTGLVSDTVRTQHGGQGLWTYTRTITMTNQRCPTGENPGSVPSSDFPSTEGRSHISVPLGQADSPLRLSPENQRPHPASNWVTGHPGISLTIQQPQRLPRRRRRVGPRGALGRGNTQGNRKTNSYNHFLESDINRAKGAITQASEGGFEN